ncbi:hypothetical protein ACFX5K_01245 [Rickettsiales bacterium LUAb2]
MTTRLGEVWVNDTMLFSLKADDTHPAYNNIDHSNALYKFNNLQNLINMELSKGKSEKTLIRVGNKRIKQICGGNK